MSSRTGRPAAAALVLSVGVLLSGCVSDETVPEAQPAAAEATPAPSPTSMESATPTPPAPTPTVEPTPTAWPDAPLAEDFGLALEVVAEGLDQPIFVTAPPDDDRLFIVEKVGRIRIVEDGELQPEPLLDIRDDVLAGDLRGEQGMFALAFHPDHAANGRLFVHYTARPDGDTRVEEYRISASHPDRADTGTRRAILAVEQPFRWHNGGMMMFGPDGMLWLSLGDGGVKNDPAGHGQNPATLLGAILRLDVDRPAAGKAYGIPADSPFADGGQGAPEVWAYGLRNPWRFDVDPRERLVYIADAGEYRFEEINVVPVDQAGANFGWAVREGGSCFRAGDDCPSEGLVDPAVAYVHDGVACAVIGGHVYRGTAMPELAGRYVYTDFCDGKIRSFRHQDGGVVDERDHAEAGDVSLPTSFGMDADGELYLTSAEGTVYRLVAAPR